MSDCGCDIEIYHLNSTVADLQHKLDDLLGRVIVLEVQLQDERVRRRVLSSRVDAREMNQSRGRGYGSDWVG